MVTEQHGNRIGNVRVVLECTTHIIEWSAGTSSVGSHFSRVPNARARLPTGQTRHTRTAVAVNQGRASLNYHSKMAAVAFQGGEFNATPRHAAPRHGSERSRRQATPPIEPTAPLVLPCKLRCTHPAMAHWRSTRLGHGSGRNHGLCVHARQGRDMEFGVRPKRTRARALCCHSVPRPITAACHRKPLDK